jgi:hypothetical protein
MISIEEQEQLLVAIGRRIKKPITAYAIEGTAMMFLGFKDTTLDIDIVFKSNKDRDVFAQAVKEIGYQEMDAVIVYGTKENRPKMYTLGDERLDLFVINGIDFDFSPPMIERAEQTHQFDDNLTLHIASPHDIILMKCATDRIKDRDDAQKIITSVNIDWNILMNEAKIQIERGRTIAAFNLGEFLEKLKYKMDVNVPKKVLDRLFDVVKKQVEERESNSS